MRYREFLGLEMAGSNFEGNALPNGYHLIGHVALLNVPVDDLEYIKIIGKLTLEYDSRVKSVAVRTGPTQGIRRIPSYRVIAGTTNTVTTHVENGVKFHLDPLRITFSGGNREERISFPKWVKGNEHVVDMFSCVGQFALHVACKTNARVTAIEINPDAFRFLKENILINAVQDRVESILGDCRNVTPNYPANRIIMGYLHDTIKYIPTAVGMLSSQGGWIHMHTVTTKRELAGLCNTINTLCGEHGFDATSKWREIKNYSPGMTHYVFDIELQ